MKTQPTMIVTGASRGLGAQIALDAAEQGFRVVLAARGTDNLEAQVQKIEERGGQALCVKADISCFEDCQKIVDQTIRAFGSIDVLVNNAAIVEPLAKVTEDCHKEWMNLITVNLLGPVMMCQQAVPYIRKTQGKVINISSITSIHPFEGASAYCSSKAALNHFTAVLAIEEPEITVLALDPGGMSTDMELILRDKGKGKLADWLHEAISSNYEPGGTLTSPKVASQSAVALSLRSPREWSGSFLQLDDERVKGLIREV